MQLRAGDGVQYNAHLGLSGELRRAHTEARLMRNHTGILSGVESHMDAHNDGLRPHAWRLMPDQVEDLRNRTAIITGRESAATNSVSEALANIRDARLSYSAGDIPGADRHANAAMNNFHAAEYAVEHSLFDLRPRLGGGTYALLGLATLGLGGAVLGEHVVTADD